ncbi:hypothetical protein SUGI_0438340 [Cryptomeria japonica]|nr:hypothetical protein SUGI_0438340 [Cryptomeria japonica]
MWLTLGRHRLRRKYTAEDAFCYYYHLPQHVFVIVQLYGNAEEGSAQASSCVTVDFNGCSEQVLVSSVMLLESVRVDLIESRLF